MGTRQKAEAKEAQRRADDTAKRMAEEEANRKAEEAEKKRRADEEARQRAKAEDHSKTVASLKDEVTVEVAAVAKGIAVARAQDVAQPTDGPVLPPKDLQALDTACSDKPTRPVQKKSFL